MHLKQIKNAIFNTLIWYKKLEDFFHEFEGSLRVYNNKWAMKSNEAGDKKSGPTKVTFQRFQVSCSVLIGDYMSLHSKTGPAPINIYKDITKCRTCYGFIRVIL